MTGKNIKIKAFTAVLTAAAIAVVVFISFTAADIAVYFPDCRFYSLTGYLCPACGNTRCILAMLDGHFLKALEYNIVPPGIAVLLLMLYGELIFGCMGKKVRLIPRNRCFLAVVLSVVVFYVIGRNIFPFVTIAW